MRHINIPVFIPHLGCPHDCIFCNQRTISGKKEFDVSSVDDEINTALSSIDTGEAEVEIAFFGGSFSGIDRDLMITLLEKADKYIAEGKVSSVRLSTRPDYINGEILDILKEHHVTHIELGIQSMSDSVLSACKRGHTSVQTEKACGLIVGCGFKLVGQMMIGLPCSSAEDEVNTAKEIAGMRADAARIYPLVIFSGTALDRMTEQGSYTPLTEDEIIERSANVLEVFIENNIDVLRIGLCAQDGFSEDETVTHGLFDPAIGEKVQNEIFLRRMTNELDKKSADNIGSSLTVYAPKGSTSKVIGHKRRNLQKLRSKYGIKELKVIEKNDILGYNILIV